VFVPLYIQEKIFFVQYWWNCETCEWPHGSGVCVTCKDICHKGHKLGRLQEGFSFKGEQANFSKFYCDCGSRFYDPHFKCSAMESPKDK